MFPPMSAEEFAELKASIADNGLREPITRYRGQVIDGRNRLLACRDLGIEPVFVEWDGDGSLTAFVADRNLHRRHLNASQRAALTADVRERLEMEDLSMHAGSNITVTPTVAESARSASVSPSYLQQAIAIKRKDPEIHARIKSGELTLPQARRHVDRIERSRDLEVKAAHAEAKRVATGESRWEILYGDSLDILPEIKPGTVRLVFADPPYNIGVDYGDGPDADSLSDADYLAWTALWIEACVRLLTPDGSLWVLIGDEYADHMGVLLRQAGLHRRAWIKWYESFGVNVPGGFNRTSRHLFHCVMDPDRVVFHRDAVSRPSDRQAKYNDPRADPGGKTWDDVWGINPPIPRLVGTAAERLADFPTQLPEAILLAVVGCASEPGDLVVDPFSGSGTTGVACLKLGRRYLGGEKSAESVRVSRLRLTAAEGGLL
jgi:DNA modification methylase